MSARDSKKRGTIWNGIRDAYNVHEALDLLESLHHGTGRLFEQVRETALMALALAAVLGLFYFFG